MPEPGKSDRWNSLLETLGVPVSEPAPASPPPEASLVGEAPPAPPKPQPVSLLPPEKPKSAPKPKPTPAPAKSPSYWSRIAGALGLETAPEPEPPPAAEPPPRAVEPAPPRPPRAEPPRAEPPRAFERPARPVREPEPPRGTELPARAFEPPPPPRPPSETPALSSMFGPPTPDLDVFSLERGEPREAPPRRKSEEARDRGEEGRGPVLEYDVAEAGDLALPEDAAAERLPRGQAAGEEEEGHRRRRRRGRGRRGRGRGEGRDAGDMLPPRRAEEAPPPELEADFDLDRDEELELEETLDEDFAGPPRREEAREAPSVGSRGQRDQRDERGGRRRRRGRRGGQEREQPAAERPADFEQPEYEAEERLADRPPPARPPRRDERRDEGDVGLRDELDEHEESLEMHEGDEEHGAGVPTHKKIPTWDEAVGYLIESNMAARANSPERDSYRGGRGRSGRGRGGRGR